MKVILLKDGSEKSAACREIIKTLPEWFGIPSANENYINGMAECDVFAASNGDRFVGAIALKYHFMTTAEIWWMGIKPSYHGQGIGRVLFESAKEHALKNGCTDMALNTMSDRSDYQPYAKTRDFYTRCGFKPLCEFNEHDPSNPMMWMILKL